MTMKPMAPASRARCRYQAPERRHDVSHAHPGKQGTNRLRGRDAVHAGHLDVVLTGVDEGRCLRGPARSADVRRASSRRHRAIGGLRGTTSMSRSDPSSRQVHANHHLIKVGHSARIVTRHPPVCAWGTRLARSQDHLGVLTLQDERASGVAIEGQRERPRGAGRAR